MIWFALRLLAGLFVLTRRSDPLSRALGFLLVPPVVRPAAIAVRPARSIVDGVLRAARHPRAWLARR